MCCLATKIQKNWGKEKGRERYFSEKHLRIWIFLCKFAIKLPKETKSAHSYRGKYRLWENHLDQHAGQALWLGAQV